MNKRDEHKEITISVMTEQPARLDKAKSHKERERNKLEFMFNKIV